MKLTIHTNHRRPPWWIFLLWPWFACEKKSIARQVCFFPNCKYDLPGIEDDLDVNKLFGIGYFWNKRESARFGWNYNNQTSKIDLFAYTHRGGQVDFVRICELMVASNYLLILNVHDLSYSFEVINLKDSEAVGLLNISKAHKKKLSYNLGLYFGGTQKAPHDVTIEIKKPTSHATTS